MRFSACLRSRQVADITNRVSATQTVATMLGRIPNHIAAASNGVEKGRPLMYVIGSYLILLALVLMVAVALFVAAVVVVTVREIAKLVRDTAAAVYEACARAAGEWVSARPEAGFWPHHREQHSH